MSAGCGEGKAGGEKKEDLEELEEQEEELTEHKAKEERSGRSTMRNKKCCAKSRQ